MAGWIRRRLPVLAAAVVVCSGPLAGVGSAATPAASGVVWTPAQEVPGTATVNLGNAAVNSVSCPSAGNCDAGGYYTVKSGGQEPFVADEVNGAWGKAKEVPGIASLNADQNSEILSVSCGSAGNCSAGGYYNNASGEQAFIVDEVNGAWGNAKEVPGTKSLNTGGGASVTAISCGSAGNCSAGGAYSTSGSAGQLFVVSEVNGTWGRAEELPGIAALNSAGDTQINSISCASAGNCAAAGYYVGASLFLDSFVADEVNGVWGDAMVVPGMTALLHGGSDEVNSVSCSSAGNCSAGGGYHNAGYLAFVVSEVNGTWGNAKEVPGFSALSTRGQVNSVSCSSAGNCSAGGAYTDKSDYGQAFVVAEVNGTWGRAARVAGASSRQPSLPSAINSVSCASTGNCSAGGYYTDRVNQAFVVDEVNGTWGRAQEVPGTSALNLGGNFGAEITSMSCPPGGTCGAGGFYTDKAQNQQALVVSQKQASAVALNLSAPTATYGKEQALTASVTVSASDVPTGTVTVKAGAKVLCAITLVGGAGSCRPSARELPVGRYQVTASYPGDGNNAASRSPAQHLQVSQSALCPTAFVVGLHGLGEGPSKTVKKVSPTIADTFGAFKAEAKVLHKTGGNVDPYGYDTIPVSDFSTLARINQLVGKVNRVAGELESQLEAFSRVCPVTGVALTGYSMGAWIINDLLSSYKTEWKQIRAVDLYGDPCWFDSASNNKGLVRYAEDLGCAPKSSYPYPDRRSKALFRVRSVCISKDPVCGAGFPHINEQLKALKACIKGSCPHDDYVKGYPRNGATVAGGIFLAKYT